jgi:hypothetical protein
MKPSTRAKYKQVGNMLYKEERLTSDVKIENTTDCHVWQGASHRQGYGMMGYIDATTEKSHMNVVHRIAMTDHLNRELDSSEMVIHKCHNLKCINPAHLTLGNASQRYANMVAKGNQVPRTGLKVRGVDVKQNRNYKYTEQEILWVRQATPKEIAERYNIDKTKAANLRWGMRKGFKWLK